MALISSAAGWRDKFRLGKKARWTYTRNNDQMQQDCNTLTFRGTEKFAVRMMASAIAWAYQGYKSKYINK